MTLSRIVIVIAMGVLCGVLFGVLISACEAQHPTYTDCWPEPPR